MGFSLCGGSILSVVLAGMQGGGEGSTGMHVKDAHVKRKRCFTESEPAAILVKGKNPSVFLWLSGGNSP